MTALSRIALVLCVVTAIDTASMATAQDSAAIAPPAKTAARCSTLYGLVNRYEIKPVGTSNTAARLRGDVARADCERGNYARGMRDLERILRRGLIPIPVT